MIKSTFKAVMIILLALCTFTSCKEEEEVVEELSFELNGELITFTEINGGLDIFDNLIIVGTIGEKQKIEIGLLNTNEGAFTQDDIDESVALGESNYDLDYTDEKGNLYSYYNFDSSESHFTIKVDNFGSKDGELISGTFEGLLDGSLLNGSAAPDSVVITNGKFTLERADASLENIYKDLK